MTRRDAPFPWFTVLHFHGMTPRMNSVTIERFWSKVERTPTCWIWKASRRAKGYGAFVWANPDGTVIQGRAHRFSWELCNGPIPDGLCVLHRCDNPSCVRPEHLFLGTRSDNNQDMRAKGRHVAGGLRLMEQGGIGRYVRGDLHPMAKMDAEKVRLLRQAADTGRSMSSLAREHGIGLTTVFKIIHRITWSHV